MTKKLPAPVKRPVKKGPGIGWHDDQPPADYLDAEIATAKKAKAAAVPPTRRPLCRVCKARLAFNEDGTCNDQGCPSYSMRLKVAAAARERELEEAAFAAKMRRDEELECAAELRRTAREMAPSDGDGGIPVRPALKDAVGFRWRSEDGLHGVLHVVKSGKAADYLFSWIAKPAVFQLTKLERGRQTAYTVIVAKENSASFCGCDGHKRGGECKHVDAMRAIIAQKKL